MEMGEAGLNRLIEGFPIEKGHHQNLAARTIDHNAGQQTLTVELGQKSGTGFSIAVIIGAHRVPLLQDNHMCRAKKRGAALGAFHRKQIRRLRRCGRPKAQVQGPPPHEGFGRGRPKGDLPNRESGSPMSFVTRTPGAQAPGVFVFRPDRAPHPAPAQSRQSGPAQHRRV